MHINEFLGNNLLVVKLRLRSSELRELYSLRSVSSLVAVKL